MVSISRGAPAASNIRSVASMISGPMPSPWATVMGVFVDIRETPGYWNAPHRASTIRGFSPQRRFLEPRGEGEAALSGTGFSLSSPAFRAPPKPRLGYTQAERSHHALDGALSHAGYRRAALRAVILVLSHHSHLPARRRWQLGLHRSRSTEPPRVHRPAEPGHPPPRR